MKKSRFSLSKRSNQWPFWLLLAAWACANVPQSITFNLIVWTGGARHFSHQAQLKADVAFLLSGERPGEIARVQHSLPPKPSHPAVPAEGLVKKIELFAWAELELIGPLVGEWKFSPRLEPEPDLSRSEPLLPPPRDASFV